MYDPGQLYFDPILTGFSVGFRDQTLYGDQLFPITRVNTQSGRYRVFDRSDWLIYRDVRAPQTVANEVAGRKWSEDVFNVREHSLQSGIADEERQVLQSQGGLADPTFGGGTVFDPEGDAVRLITRSIQLKREQLIANTIRLASNYAGSHTTTLTSGATGTQWSNYALATAGDVTTAYSNPVSDLRTAMRRVYLDSGFTWPNTMIIPFDAVGIIENHPRVVARYQYTNVFDPNAWKQLLGLPAGVADNLNVFVVDSQYNSADNIDATVSMSSFWGQDVWLGIVNNQDGQNIQTFGKTFAWPYPQGDILPTDRWREEAFKRDVVRTSMRYDLKIVSASAGYLIKTAVVAAP